VIGNPIAVFALMVLDFQAVGGGEAVLPGQKKSSTFIVGNKIIVRIVGKQNDAPVSVFGDAMAVFYWIVGTIEHAPVAMRAIAERVLTENFAIASIVGGL
jgi:hypothetical protein